MARPPASNPSAAAILAGMAILLALAGQYMFSLSHEPPLSAIVCFALAAGCLLLAERLARKRP
jgi:hypothetical protein